MDLTADFSIIFGWQPSEIQELNYSDLVKWYEKAVDRHKTMNRVK